MKGAGVSEDVLSLILGLVIFAVALGLLAGVDILGWVVTTSVWTDLGKALARHRARNQRSEPWNR